MSFSTVNSTPPNLSAASEVPVEDREREGQGRTGQLHLRCQLKTGKERGREGWVRTGRGTKRMKEMKEHNSQH